MGLDAQKMEDKAKGRAALKSVTSQQMQAIDKIAQERFKITALTLMENAGAAATSLACDMLDAKKEEGRVAVFCGKGNNGGDGLVVSRHLVKRGLKVITYILCGENQLKNDPAVNLRLLKKLGANIVILKEKGALESLSNLSDYDLIVDAIFGTGFKGKPAGPANEIIGLINRSGVKVLSVDVPSGLDATTGRAEGACVNASKTITFGISKTGFYKLDGPRFAKDIIVKNIGFPDSLLENPPL